MPENLAGEQKDKLGRAVSDPGNRWFLIAIIAVLVAIPVFIRDPYILHVLIMIFVYVIYTSTYRFVLRLNQLLFGAHAFIAIGAYASTLLSMRLGVPVWVSMPLAGIISALVAILIGIPALRIKGIYFAIITWGFAEAVRFMFIRIKNPFGGNAGIRDVPHPEAIPLPYGGVIDFWDKTPNYFLALVITLLTLWIIYRLEKSKYGLVFGSIRESDKLAESIGINLMRYKVLAFAICMGLTGLGGAFFAHYMVFITVRDFTVLLTIYLALFVCVGGLNDYWGPIIGTVVFSIVGEFVAGFAQYRTMLFTGITILALLFMPDGIVGLPTRLKSSWVRSQERKAV